MNYNMKCEIERVRGVYVATVEVSGIGRAGNKRVSSETFPDLLAKVKAAHDELLGNVEAYHSASAPVAPPTHHSEEPKRQSSKKAPVTAKGGKKKKLTAAKEPKRQFAAEA